MLQEESESGQMENWLHPFHSYQTGSWAKNCLTQTDKKLWDKNGRKNKEFLGVGLLTSLTLPNL